MLIQPYIENAIWHGLRYKEDKGKLIVEITEENNMLKISIEDNGIGRKKSQEIKTKNQKDKTSTGIKNIFNRLTILNKTYKMNIRSEIIDMDAENKTGTKVILLIPQKPENNA